jgi:Zn-dependent protease
VGNDIPLGRIAGTRVGMSWTVPLIAAVYVVNLAQVQLPRSAPGYESSSYWIAGGVGALLFFLSLLAHEVGHAVVARSEGVGVQGISLNLFGGVAKLEHEASSAGAELRIAAIGPLVTGATGLFFWALAKGLDNSFGNAAIFAEVFAWLAFINLLLAAVNMLPGVPLDGGRVLGALLWMGTRNRSRGQLVGARIGQGLGALLILLGGRAFLSDDNSTIGQYAIWFVVLGAVILTAASSEARTIPLLTTLRGVTVGQVMDPDPPLAPEWMTVHDFLAHHAANMPHRAYPVQAPDGRITGLLTADAIRAAGSAAWPTLLVSHLAFPLDRVLLATVDEPVLPLVQRSEGLPCDQILVLWPDGRVAGIIGPEAAQRAVQVHQAEQAAAAGNVPA